MKTTPTLPPEPPPPPFKTRDLDLASGLVAAGCVLITHERDEQLRTWFIFEDAFLCESRQTAFWKKQLPVDALSFASARKELLTRAKGGPRG